MKPRKAFVLDTSVLLYDMHSIHSFPGNDVVIPIMVLDELDRFKDKSSLLGASARYVNRFLDDLREYGNLSEGIEVANLPDFGIDQTIRVDLTEKFPANYPKSFRKDRGDNVILACALNLQQNQKDKTVKIVTKDINLRVKADSLGVQAEDYLADHIHINKNQMYSGFTTIELTQGEIDRAYDDGSLALCDDVHEFYPNQGIVGKSPEGGSVLALVHNDRFECTRREFDGMGGIVPKKQRTTIRSEYVDEYRHYTCEYQWNRRKWKDFSSISVCHGADNERGLQEDSRYALYTACRKGLGILTGGSIG